GLLALAGILGVGEGHLFHHRKARRLVSGDFAKLGSLFQSFPNANLELTPLGKTGGFELPIC
ncbi:hypothetical protein NLO86_27980, partial [Pseudomonas savastanoi]|uniref:hypothetical protein n=1 Tax=Pseudomonas savastanoi TaxID=29438 RepID=UPI00210D6A98